MAEVGHADPRFWPKPWDRCGRVRGSAEGCGTYGEFWKLIDDTIDGHKQDLQAADLRGRNIEDLAWLDPLACWYERFHDHGFPLRVCYHLAYLTVRNQHQKNVAMRADLARHKTVLQHEASAAKNIPSEASVVGSKNRDGCVEACSDDCTFGGQYCVVRREIDANDANDGAGDSRTETASSQNRSATEGVAAVSEAACTTPNNTEEGDQDQDQEQDQEQAPSAARLR